MLPIDTPTDDLLALDEALERLADEDPQTAELVKLRYFAGLSHRRSRGSLGHLPRQALIAIGPTPEPGCIANCSKATTIALTNDFPSIR